MRNICTGGHPSDARSQPRPSDASYRCCTRRSEARSPISPPYHATDRYRCTPSTRGTPTLAGSWCGSGQSAPRQTPSSGAGSPPRCEGAHTRSRSRTSHTYLSHPIAVRRRTIPLKWYAGGGVRLRVLRRCGVQLLCLRQPNVNDEPDAVRYSRCVAETGARLKRGV